MFSKILIANRGEIALRVIRACKELGVSTVAVHSTADSDAMHVRMADESVCIGPASPALSYLNVASILSAAELTEVDAIYPGYGFLAEDSNFAEMCEKSGFKFIGPSSDIIRKMGDKITAKTLAEKSGIQIVPGYKGALPEDESELSKIVDDIGYPIMIKATAGGGGRGMRMVRDESELFNSLEVTIQEALNAFGNGTVYLEKFIENPRHVEVQIVGDGKGQAIHLGTRDCSMQRKHQKIIEEAPALDVDEKSLNQTLHACVDLCKEIKYEGVGTIEFLYENEEFYFIEMNTRIQVEHPVTEMLTGIDLVEAQFLIAQGAPFESVKPRQKQSGHAIEFRINAEDWEQNFRPNPGKLIAWSPPKMSGVRVDSAAYEGYYIVPFYDSMIAKLIVYADSRDLAISKAKDALKSFKIEGIKTTAGFHEKILNQEAFLTNNISTRWVDEVFLENNT
mgnify:CR=1 FL=1